MSTIREPSNHRNGEEIRLKVKAKHTYSIYVNQKRAYGEFGTEWMKISIHSYKKEVVTENTWLQEKKILISRETIYHNITQINSTLHIIFSICIMDCGLLFWVIILYFISPRRGNSVRQYCRAGVSYTVYWHGCDLL